MGRGVGALVWLACAGAALGQSPPVVTVTRDNTVIDRSCVVRIPPGLVIPDADGNGVIHVGADRVKIEFERGSILWGAPPGTPGDELRGIGVRVDGREGVLLENLSVHGFKHGVVATGTNRLLINGANLSGNYRQRLRSTPTAEDGSDWLWPHQNDGGEWASRYGAALVVAASEDVTIRGVAVRAGQNGIILDRVNRSRVFDNDCSFLSGWGLAMWRSSDNVISRNAFDFCVRGHVEGVYNRGQDSAGILMFEQCNRNVIAENSATHSGDGLFGFAGLEAIGDDWLKGERARLRERTGRDDVDDLVEVPPELAHRLAALGCNDNLIIDNDFSYAPAHGIEMTFSEGNMLVRNRLVENAICGVWGGYSSRTVIADNFIAGNGGMAYGLERGGVNIEHGADNLIVGNRFVNNRCGVHLWWDRDPGLARNPGVMGGARGVVGNVIARNTFVLDARHPFSLRPGERLPMVQIRNDGGGVVRDNLFVDNDVSGVDERIGRVLLCDEGTEPVTSGEVPTFELPRYEVYGSTRPVGARSLLAGRSSIVMTEWGPWDHRSPLVRLAGVVDGGQLWEVWGVEGLTVSVDSEGVAAVLPATLTGDPPRPVIVRAEAPGVWPYTLTIRGAGGFVREVTGVLMGMEWEVSVFRWSPRPGDEGKPLPPPDLEAWRALERDGVRARLPALSLRYGMGGPSDVGMSEAVTAAGLGGDYFGTIARSRVRLPAGAWRVRTTSDDGVRVLVDGRAVIENWTWHGPTEDRGRFVVETEREVELVVEHFEINGYAVLELNLERDE